MVIDDFIFTLSITISLLSITILTSFPDTTEAITDKPVTFHG